ncbi:MAG: WYL domain-containing protein [Myxococcales bacterium]|nr:WYL domain-containing protein [Myxococcales bacterium]
MSDHEHLKQLTRELFRNALLRANKPLWLNRADEHESFTLELNAKQLICAALAVSVLNELVHGGGLAVSPAITRSVMRQVAQLLPRATKREIQVETAGILDWLSGALALLPADDEPWPTWHETEADLEQHLATIRRAMDEKLDLEIHYYSHWRREMTIRRVTPIKLDAARYLQAYCHLRDDERVFRLSRIHEVALAAPSEEPGTPAS